MDQEVSGISVQFLKQMRHNGVHTDYWRVRLSWLENWLGPLSLRAAIVFMWKQWKMIYARTVRIYVRSVHWSDYESLEIDNVFVIESDIDDNRFEQVQIRNWND